MINWGHYGLILKMTLPFKKLSQFVSCGCVKRFSSFIFELDFEERKINNKEKRIKRAKASPRGKLWVSGTR